MVTRLVEAGDNAGAGPFRVVAIGASAGGLEALEQFFANTPPDTGFAFVVIQHLAPDFKSMMDELLRRYTNMPVFIAENNQSLRPDGIYLIPPRVDMIISSGRLLLSERDTSAGLNLPIDLFFRSLANDLGSASIGVVLSGTGSDGSRGVVAIHEAGGLVVVQDPETATFDGMPKSALATGVVDARIPPESMPGFLKERAREIATSPFDTPVGTLLDDHSEPDTYDAVFRLLSEHHNVDFHQYKLSTIARRVERRVRLRGCRTVEEYVRLLTTEHGEITDLYHDLLIGVTEFFRDGAVWDVLAEQVLQRLFDELPADQEMRCWVAGTATGQEAYSLAMLVHETATRMGRQASARIFATDLHKSSIEFAGLGVYSAEALEGLSDARRARWFVARDDGQFQVNTELRRLVVFAQHNLISDPPFTKLDLVTCRNLLIYLQAPAQHRALTLFHFGLRRGGALFLGSSEALGDLEGEFDTIDRRHKIYAKRRDGRLSVNLRDVRAHDLTVVRPHLTPLTRLSSATLQQQLLRAYDTLLDTYVPPALLIDSNGTLLHTFGRAAEMLRPVGGRTSVEASTLVYPELRIPLTSGIQRLHREGGAVSYGGIRVRLVSGEERIVRMHLRPLGLGTRDDAILVVFETEEQPELPGSGGAAGQLGLLDATGEVPAEQPPTSADHLRYLEAELRYARENLQATVEELETTNEELQATNEELMASNEELQSSNEELHSVNEELYTVNKEYETKIEELTQLTDDIENLLESTQIGTVFLDAQLRVRKFTPAAAEQFNLLPQDIGRPIAHMSRNIELDDFVGQLRTVLLSGQVTEEEVQHHNGTWYLMRLHPYRTESGHVDGVVVTFVDIQTMKHVTASLARRNADLRGFAYGVSHDLQEPVRIIISFADVLRRRYGGLAEGDGADAESVGPILDEVGAAASRLRKMLDAILVYSRVDTRARPAVEVPLSTVMNTVQQALAVDVTSAGALLEIGPLPAVYGDETQLVWLMKELITNALRFRGTEPPHVTISASKEPTGFVRIDVRDNGVGIPANQQEVVFEMFKRLQPRATHAGLGAGLTIARRIVERHGGEIHADASVTAGSLVWFTVPADAESTRREQSGP